MKGSTSSAGEPGCTSDLEPASTARASVRRLGLLRAAQAGDRGAREQLVTSSFGVVRSVASRYRDLGLPFDDVVQEGALGLLDAIDHYDPDRGVCFETYARFRIRRAIRSALTDTSRLIRLPKQAVERRRAIERAEARLAAASAGRTPTTAEIAALTGLPVQTIRAVRSAQLEPVSLDEPVLADGSPLTGVIADPHAADPEVITLEHERTRQLAAALADLSERQRQVVSCKWGIGRNAMANGVLATKLELSPRRAQTIGRDALYELRNTLDPAASTKRS
jgi:RNA polymerase primary sigma factor